MELTNDFTVGVPISHAWEVLTDVERIAPCLPGAKLEEVEGDEYRGIVKVKVGPITAQYKGAAHFVEKDDANHKAVLSASGRDTRGQGNASATITATLTESAGNTMVHVVTDLNVTGKVAQFGRGVMADVSAKLLQQFVENLETTVLGDGNGSASTGSGASASADAEPTAAAPAKKAAKKAVAKKAVAKKAVAKKAVASAPAGAGAGTSSSAPAMKAESTGEPPAAATEPAAPTIRKIDHPEPEPVDLVEAAGSSVAKRVVPVLVVLIIVFLLLRWRRRRRSA